MLNNSLASQIGHAHFYPLVGGRLETWVTEVVRQGDPLPSIRNTEHYKFKLQISRSSLHPRTSPYGGF